MAPRECDAEQGPTVCVCSLRLSLGATPPFRLIGSRRVNKLWRSREARLVVRRPTSPSSPCSPPARCMVHHLVGRSRFFSPHLPAEVATAIERPAATGEARHCRSFTEIERRGRGRTTHRPLFRNPLVEARLRHTRRVMGSEVWSNTPPTIGACALVDGRVRSLAPRCVARGAVVTRRVSRWTSVAAVSVGTAAVAVGASRPSGQRRLAARCGRRR